MNRGLLRILFFGCILLIYSESKSQVRSQDSLSQVKVDSVLNGINRKLENRSDTLEISNVKKNRIEAPQFSNIISISKIIWSIIILVIGYALIRLTSRIFEIFAERNTKYRFVVKGLVPIIKIFGWILIITLIIAGVFKPPAATLLAFSASIGVAVGFASQDILKNIFAGITIILDQPFKVGDKIEINKYYGEVVGIGLRSTQLVTADDSLVTVPNNELMNQSLANSNSGESNCQVVAEFFLPVDIDANEVRSIALEAIKVSKYVYLNKPVTVLFFHEVVGQRTFLKMKAKAYVFDIRDEFKFKSDMTEIIIKELLKIGIEI